MDSIYLLSLDRDLLSFLRLSRSLSRDRDLFLSLERDLFRSFRSFLSFDLERFRSLERDLLSRDLDLLRRSFDLDLLDLFLSRLLDRDLLLDFLRYDLKIYETLFCGKLYFHISLNGLGILSNIFGKIRLEIGKNRVFLALGKVLIFGPKIGLEKSLFMHHFLKFAHGYA